jgi:putative ABC transport system permease protein
MPSWKFPFRKRTLDPQYEAELRFHIEKLTDENIAAGMTPEEARRRAVLEFGGAEQIKEELRDVQRMPVLETTLKNFQWALRFIRKSPSFSIVVILTLALGIGANSAVFSAIDAILLRPLPYPEGDRLMELQQVNQKVQRPQTRLAPPRLEDWNRLNSTFEGITGYYTEDDSETSGALPEKIKVVYVAPRFLQVFGVAPALGRDFNSAEGHFGGPNAILISDHLWRRRFAADPNVLIKQLRIHDSVWSIVGVMPASFAFPDRDAEAWLPVPPDAPYAQHREWGWFVAMGRLKPGVTVDQARSDLETLQAQLGKQYPQTDADLTPGVVPLKETTISGVRSSLWMLFGAVSLLLLITCTNIVALLLARGAQRQHEISVRLSLGASRLMVVCQLLTESFVLALTGALVGLVVAGAASNAFRGLAKDLPRVEEIHLDGRIVFYTLVCSVFATLLCGLFPAFRGTRGNLSGALAQASRSQVSGHTPLQWFLVGVQVALAVTLLGGAGLLLRSFQALGHVSPGFDPQNVLTFHITGSYGETVDLKKLRTRITRTLDELRAVPGVESAATSIFLPGVPNAYQNELTVSEGGADPNRKIIAETRIVSPSYFATMKIPLLAGELCREDGNSFNVMVNRSFANTYFPGTSIIGRHLQEPGNPLLPGGEIRGITGDAREEGLNREPGPAVYWCVSAPDPDPYYLVRTRTVPTAMAGVLRRKIKEIEPARSVFDIIPLEEHLNDAFGENRLRTILLTFFAVTAVSLACIGLYGTLSYSVAARRREVGLRLALGALQGQIVKQFLQKGLAVTFLGCLAGWGLAAAFARVLSGMLYGVSPSDAATLFSVVLLMMLVAAFAALIPSLRAAHVDPMQVLREE